MASKKKKHAKKSGSKAKKRGKTKAAARTKAKPKLKAKAKAKAKAKPKTKAKTKATRAKPRAAVRAKPKTRTPAPVTSQPPQVLDEVIEESLLDVSGILRIKDAAARSQRDVDEDALQQFPDPSLVVEVEQRKAVGADDSGDLPDLFAAEERRQKSEPTNGEPQRDDEPLFGKLRSDSDD